MTASMTLAETAYVLRRSPQKASMPERSGLKSVFMAWLTAFALVATSASPVHADRRDTLKAVAAIAAIAIIANAVKDKKHRDQRPLPSRSLIVPGVCAIEIGSGRGIVRGYAGRCLREEGFNHRLPSGCATNIRIYGRADTFFPEHCLRQAGFNTRPH